VIVLVILLGIGVQGEAFFRYSVDDGSFKIRLFGLFDVRRIELRRVKSISPIALKDWLSKGAYLWCERWGGWALFFRGVALTLEGGKTILVAPKDRQRFVTLVGAEVGRLKSTTLALQPHSRN